MYCASKDYFLGARNLTAKQHTTHFGLQRSARILFFSKMEISLISITYKQQYA